MPKGSRQARSGPQYTSSFRASHGAFLRAGCRKDRPDRPQTYVFLNTSLEKEQPIAVIRTGWKDLNEFDVSM